MNKTLFILPFLGIMLAACSKQETAPAVKTISFDSHTFKEGKHNNSPVANGDSTYTEFGATFSINYYYSYLSGVMLSDDGVKPDLEGEYIGYDENTRGVINVSLTGDKESDAKILKGANNTAGYSVWFYESYMRKDYHPSVVFEDGVSHKVKSLYVNNTACNWQRMHIGLYSRPGFVEGDYLDITFTGYGLDGKETGHVTVSLGDYRNGKKFIMEDWTKVDLSSLGEIHELRMTASASEAYITNHSYGTQDAFSFAACVDEIEFDISEE